MFINRQGSDPKPEPKAKPKYRKIRRVSKKMSRRLEVYKIARKIHLLENPNCEVCGKEATEVHHQKGRIGELLTNMRYFLSVCRGCHMKIENEPLWAIEKGYSKFRNR